MNPKIRINFIEPRNNLYVFILGKIEQEKKRMAKIRLIYTSIIGVVSLAGSIPVLQYFLEELARSGFYQYFSLILSDGGTALTYWKEFSLSLVESLPVLGTTALLTILFILLVVSNFIIKDYRTIFNRQLA